MISIEGFEPDEPENIASAMATQVIAIRQAHAIEGETLPLPPNNLPALKSISGGGITGAHVFGYVVKAAKVMDCIAPDGSLKVPGDKGFYEAQLGRLKAAPMPKGWMFETRQTNKLFALVSGNPMLLEAQAKGIGYSRALATGPNSLDLGEIEIESLLESSDQMPVWQEASSHFPRSPIATLKIAPVFSVGQKFDFKAGDQVVANGYRGTVAKVCDGQLDGMVEVRLSGDVACMSASFPECFPAVINGVEVVTEGKFFGKVEEVGNQFVVQNAGRGRVVAHETHRFGVLPVAGQTVNLESKGGKVDFMVEPVKSPDIGR